MAGDRQIKANGPPRGRPSASDQRLAAILDHAADAIIVADEHGVIENANLSAARLFGWEACELVGQHLEVLMGEGDARRHQGYVDGYLRTGLSGILNVGPRSLVARRRDGAELNIELSVGVAWVAGERKFIGSCRDISQQIASESVLAETVSALNRTVAQLQASGAALEQARRQSEALARSAEAARAEAEAANLAKSRFLATMSHEIRTPLNGVISVADVLAERIAAPADRDLVDIIRQSGRTLLSLLNEVLDLSKIEAGAFMLAEAPFSLRRLLDSLAVTWRSAAAAKGLELRFVAPDLPQVIGDENRLRQVVSNLLSNAVKFTDAGWVSLRCDCRRTEAGRAVVELSVVDTGCGFDAEFAKRMFEPFVQADSTNTRRYGGTGLGLAICRELVELMGGQIGAEAVSPHGAKFTLRLELRLASEAADPVLADSARRARALADVGKRVLVAEDHPLNRLVMGVLLDELGVAHEMVEHGAAAVEAVTRDDFDAVLMDLQMPIMDGLEATRAIRRLPGGRGQVPIIAVTADVMSDHVEGCMTAGMNDFLAKPVQPHALQQVLFKYLSDDEGRRVAS